MIRKWEVFSDFFCSPEIISSLHTLRILIAFPWHLCTDLLGKHFPSLRDAGLLGPEQTQGQSDSGFGNGKYTFVLCTFFHGAPPTATQHTPWWGILISTTPTPSFGTCSSLTVPTPLQQTPRCYWNCYLLPGRTILSHMDHEHHTHYCLTQGN